MSARGRGEIDRNEERRVPRRTIPKEEEREEGCLSVWLPGIMMAAVLDPFLLERDPFEYLLRDGLVGGRGDP